MSFFEPFGFSFLPSSDLLRIHSDLPALRSPVAQGVFPLVGSIVGEQVGVLFSVLLDDLLELLTHLLNKEVLGRLQERGLIFVAADASGGYLGEDGVPPGSV